MTSDPDPAPAMIDDSLEPATPTQAAPPNKRAGGIPFKFLIPAVIALDILAVMLVPPFPEGGTAGQACGFPVLLRPERDRVPAAGDRLRLLAVHGALPAPMLYFHPSISSTILTMWIVMAFILLLALVATRRHEAGPRPAAERRGVGLRVRAGLRGGDRR